MDKKLLEELVDNNYSTRQIAKQFGKGQSSVRYWLKKYDLKTKGISFKDTPDKKYGVYRYCPGCKKDCLTIDFYKRRDKENSSSYCKICTTKNTLKRMHLLKAKCVEYKGGKCIICGYDKYQGALDFHHVNSMEKEFEISKLRKYTFNDKIKSELDKCVLLCCRCHREVEGGIIDLTHKK